jgi:kynurenine formamidase
MRRDERGVARRGMLGILSVVAALGSPGKASSSPVPSPAGELRLHGRPLRVVDLTHRLTSEFNLTPSRKRIAMEPIDGSGVAVGMKLNLLSLVEHTGTHIDAPRHFSDTGASLGEIPIADLATPLVILDLKARVRSDRGYAVAVADILAWERRHGRLPQGCCVAMNTGWDPVVESKRWASLPPADRRKGPGFGLEAAEFLMRERQVKGIAVDAMSIDTGENGPAYPVHQAWLRSGRWGIEGLTNLDAPPPAGAILIVGAPPIQDATGMPIRAVAIF